MEPYRSLQPNASLLLPQTELKAARMIVLPTGQTVDPGVSGHHLHAARGLQRGEGAVRAQFRR